MTARGPLRYGPPRYVLFGMVLLRRVLARPKGRPTKVCLLAAHTSSFAAVTLGSSRQHAELYTLGGTDPYIRKVRATDNAVARTPLGNCWASLG
ncbi:hypothetical protein HaLaN_05258 [Haematococcus lacustris]|uniref:Uncharacterized protein n=1 Tax=Haematococcus lacustris TaxID=44745 RepID=A0A699YSV7_HAELA|nr:hypothetical protein HaLaN_05258 [Haematococcus lacustris]